MRFSEVAERAIKDNNFSRKIQEAANKAAQDGVGSEAWIALAGYFAENEMELSLLIPPLATTAEGQLDTGNNTTNLLLTQNGTGITGTTTTTTTTSRLCTIPGICPRTDAADEAAQSRGSQKSTKKKRP